MESLGKDVLEQVPGATKVKFLWKFLQWLNNFFKIVDKVSILYSHRLHKKRLKELKNKMDPTPFEKRFINRNYYINSNHEIYTILNDDTVIYTRIIEIEVFKDGDINYKYKCSSSNGSISKKFEEVFNNEKRFDEFSFVYDILEDSSIENGHHLKPELITKNITKDTLSADVLIRDTSRGQKVKLGFSFTLPKDFEAKTIDTRYRSANGLLNLTIQKEIYGKFNENNNFIPKLKSVHHEKVYQPLSYKNLYYHKFQWKLWQWDWNNGEINLVYKGT